MRRQVKMKLVSIHSTKKTTYIGIVTLLKNDVAIHIIVEPTG
jgi:hypothetical protein